MTTRRLLLAGCWALALATGPALAQPIYPNPQLTVLTPAGGKAGTQVEVTLTGDHFEDVNQMVFSHPGLKAERLPDPPPDPMAKDPPPPPVKFKVTIDGNTPVGIHDVRVVGKWGISNPRAFAVGTLNEISETEPNDDVPSPQKVDVNTTINGVIVNQTDVDYFSFSGKGGQKILLHCQGGGIDSRLSPDVRVFDANGKLLAASREYSDGNAVVDVTLPGDGDYSVRVCQLAYQPATAEYFYRLSVSTTPWIDAVYPPVVEPGKATQVQLIGRNLPGGQAALDETIDGRPLEKATATVNAPNQTDQLEFGTSLLPRTGSVDGFTYRVANDAGSSNPVLLAYASAPVVLDNNANHTPAQAQDITLPCELCGRIKDMREQDWYRFTAKQGEVFYFEGYADRLGAPLDLYFMIRRIENQQILGHYDSHPQIPPRTETFFTYTDDPATRFEAPADGQYELMVASRGADQEQSPKLIYRIRARTPSPDFRLVAVGNPDPMSIGLTVRQGSSQDLQIVCYRTDEFDGEVTLSVEGLPGGVTCPPQIMGPGQREASLVLTADPGAGDGMSQIRVKGTATINGQQVTREARYGCQIWPTNQGGNVPAFSRLCQGMYVAVREKGAFGLETLTQEIVVPKGMNNVEVKYKLNGYHPDFKQNVQLRPRASAVQTNNQPIGVPNVNIGVGQEITVKFNVPQNTRPGTFNFVMLAFAQFQYKKDPMGQQQNVQVFQATPPIKFVVYEETAKITLPQPKLEIEAGKEAELVVNLERLYDYQGEYDIQVLTPGGVGGISVQQIKVPGGANEGKLVIKVAANAQPFNRNDFKIRVTSKVSNATLTQEVPFELTVTKPPEEKE